MTWLLAFEIAVWVIVAALVTRDEILLGREEARRR